MGGKLTGVEFRQDLTRGDPVTHTDKQARLHGGEGGASLASTFGGQNFLGHGAGLQGLDFDWGALAGPWAAGLPLSETAASVWPAFRRFAQTSRPTQAMSAPPASSLRFMGTAPYCMVGVKLISAEPMARRALSEQSGETDTQQDVLPDAEGVEHGKECLKGAARIGCEHG